MKLRVPSLRPVFMSTSPSINITWILSSVYGLFNEALSTVELA